MKPFFSFKNANTKWIIGLTFISVTWVNFNQERWIGKNVIEQDVSNYYSYLPALFYERDLSLSFLSDTVNKDIEGRLYIVNRTAEGNPVIKMSMGMAISYLPFFGLAHVYTKLFDYPTNGYSAPYQFALLFSSLFYYVIGLIFLSKVLKQFFTTQIVTLTLFCLTFATNVFYYLTIGGGMSHTFNFSLIAVFLYYLIKWYGDPKLKTALLIGVTGGLITLVRPINILVFVLFFLYDVKSFTELSGRFKFFLKYKVQILLIALCGFLMFLPQLLYWKYVTGKFFFNSYVGEHFYFNNPHVFKAFFGFRKGWLIYTPIMIFPLIGLFFLRDGLKRFAVPLLVFFVLYVYVVFSWWCWWYGGSFGQRALIDIYPILAIPFSAFLLVIKEQTFIKKKVIYFSIVFFVLLNLFQTIQAKYNIIHYDSMTRQNYFETFGTITKKPDREKYLKHPDYEKARMGEDED